MDSGVWTIQRSLFIGPCSGDTDITSFIDLMTARILFPQSHPIELPVPTRNSVRQF
jgi:hypothetical protein